MITCVCLSNIELAENVRKNVFFLALKNMNSSKVCVNSNCVFVTRAVNHFMSDGDFIFSGRIFACGFRVSIHADSSNICQ